MRKLHKHRVFRYNRFFAQIQSRQLSISRGFSLQDRFRSNELLKNGQNAYFCRYMRWKFWLLIDLFRRKMVLLHFSAIWEALFSFWSQFTEWKSMNELLPLYEMDFSQHSLFWVGAKPDLPAWSALMVGYTWGSCLHLALVYRLLNANWHPIIGNERGARFSAK